MNRIELLKKLIRDQPAEPFNKYALSLEYKKMGSQVQALDLFAELAEESPDYIATYFHYGSLLEELDRGEKALEVYRKGIEKATQKGDQHAVGELKNALLNLELELGL